MYLPQLPWRPVVSGGWSAAIGLAASTVNAWSSYVVKTSDNTHNNQKTTEILTLFNFPFGNKDLRSLLIVNTLGHLANASNPKPRNCCCNVTVCTSRFTKTTSVTCPDMRTN